MKKHMNCNTAVSWWGSGLVVFSVLLVDEEGCGCGGGVDRTETMTTAEGKIVQLQDTIFIFAKPNVK
jgi:hypothetical protein